LRYQGLGPAEVEFQQNVGRTAFAEDVSHPLLRGLQDKDFFTWEPGEVVYKNAYLKPQRGARSLVQCNESLLNSALLTIPINDGLLTFASWWWASDWRTIRRQTLLFNALDYGAGYRSNSSRPPRRSSRRWPKCWTRSTCNTRRRTIRGRRWPKAKSPSSRPRPPI
jgi:hypothetical protein